jgi:aryl-alcohol dehydrogenase-like predicted oxidoreductase
VIVIPSARRVAHALDSVGAGKLELSSEDLAAIERAQFSRA